MAHFHTQRRSGVRDLQEVDAASAGRRGDPDEAEAGGGLVADVGGDHAANELGSSKLPLWHHTWRRKEKRMSERPQRTVHSVFLCHLIIGSRQNIYQSCLSPSDVFPDL